MWGKLIGVFLGFALARIPGAILGLLVGHWFDRAYAEQVREGKGFSGLFKDTDLNTSRATFFHAMFATLGHLAKSKGRVTEMDIEQAQTLMHKLELHGDTMREAQHAFREGKQASFPLEKTLKQFRQDSRGRYDLLQLFMEQLVQAALNDRKLDRAEYDVLLRSARALGFNKFQLDKWLLMAGANARFQQSSRSHFQSEQQRSGQRHYQQQQQRGALEDAYQALGVQSDIDDAALKKVYRKLMREHHPDKLAAQGLPEQMMKSAIERTQDIQAAYDRIRRHRGLKT